MENLMKLYVNVKAVYTKIYNLGRGNIGNHPIDMLTLQVFIQKTVIKN